MAPHPLNTHDFKNLKRLPFKQYIVKIKMIFNITE